MSILRAGGEGEGDERRCRYEAEGMDVLPPDDVGLEVKS
jgi:hypothetical protein